MQDAIFFLGRFHVLALHLPIGMLFAAIAVDWAARGKERGTLAAAAPFLWGATAVSAVLTVALGYMHLAEGGFTGPSAGAHRLYGTLVAALCLGVWLLSVTRPALHRRLNGITGAVLLLLVTMTGHYGGNLTHGSGYLVQYAPQPLRSLVGLSARRSPVTDLATADPWHDIVGPMLEARCSNCHNDDKRNGGFSVVHYEAALVGGDTGSAVVPGNLQFSELYRRITLPGDDEAFMPAEGKTPLTPNQAEILRWWIEAGAPVATTVAEVGPSLEVARLLSAEIGLDGEAATESRVAVDPAWRESLAAAGFLARPLSLDDPRLVVSIHSVGMPLGPDQLAALRLAAEQIVSLDLRAAGLEDRDLEALEDFPALRSLVLSNNALSDAGVRVLARWPSLERVNLYGNREVDDAALGTLAEMPNLRSVYLWGTSVTPAGVAELSAARPELEVQAAAPSFTAPGQ